jgi:hypothetical protein
MYFCLPNWEINPTNIRNKKGNPMKNIFLTLFVLTCALQAKASYTCRDFYVSYVDSATRPEPTPIVVIPVAPHYHDHYPEYHGRPDNSHRHNNDRNNDNVDNADIAALAIISGLITTTAMEDAQLHDAQNVISIIDQARMGDGPQLRSFVSKVQSLVPNKTASIAEVSDEVVRANRNLEFCRAGDLDTVNELASRIADRIR